jgi:hypothetical protein
MILLTPVLASLLGVYLVIAKKRRAFLTILATNLGGSILFGVFSSIKVLCCSADPAWWLMPLFIAPLEYWAKYGIAVIVLAVAMAIWSKRQANRKLS